MTTQRARLGMRDWALTIAAMCIFALLCWDAKMHMENREKLIRLETNQIIMLRALGLNGYAEKR